MDETRLSNTELSILFKNSSFDHEYLENAITMVYLKSNKKCDIGIFDGLLGMIVKCRLDGYPDGFTSNWKTTLCENKYKQICLLMVHYYPRQMSG